jgi:putative transposase
MPDHCHALLSFSPEGEISKVIRNWKRWTARQLSIRWQVDFFDHRLRHEESFAEKFNYILANPVRQGLVPTADLWPHVWVPPNPR